MALPFSPRGNYTLTVDLNVTDIRTFNSSTYSNQHILIIPKTTIDTSRALVFWNCASVTIIGGHFRPGVNGWGYNAQSGTGTKAPGTLNFNNCGEVYLEGVLIDNQNLFVDNPDQGENGGDAVFLSGKSANTNFTVQNCAWINVRGVQIPLEAHADIFQTASRTQGATGAINFYNFTGSGDYQGFFLDPQTRPAGVTDYPDGKIGSITLRKVNLKRTAQKTLKHQLLFLFSSEAAYEQRGYPATFDEVWLDGLTGDTLEDLVWPRNGPAANDQFTNVKYQATFDTDSTGRYAEWRGLTNPGKIVSGKVYQGSPPTGDFCPPNLIGLGYVQGTEIGGGVVTPPATVVYPSTEEKRVVATGPKTYVDIRRTLPGTAILDNIALTPIPHGTWTGEGTGTLTVNTPTSIDLTTSGTGPKSARVSYATQPGQNYALTFTVAGQAATVSAGTNPAANNLNGGVNAPIGSNTVSFTALTTITYVKFSTTVAGSMFITGLAINESIWATGGPGTVTNLSNTTVRINAVGGSPTYARRVFNTIPGQTYTASWLSDSTTGTWSVGSTLEGDDIVETGPSFVVGSAPVTTVPVPAMNGFVTGTSLGLGLAPYYVTTLEDSTAVGTFRSAVSVGNRLIVFKVGGVINLLSSLNINAENLYIAGNTAPFPGIILQGKQVFLRGKNKVIKHISFHRCYDPTDLNDADGLSIRTSSGFAPFESIQNLWIDHCLFCWGIDEAVQFSHDANDARNFGRTISFTNNIFCEMLYWPPRWDPALLPHVKNEEHAYNVLIGNKTWDMDFQKNLNVGANWRSPRIGADTSIFIVNNYVYNYAGTAVMWWWERAGPVVATCFGNVVESGNITNGREGFSFFSIPSTPGSQFYFKDNYVRKGVNATVAPFDAVGTAFSPVNMYYRNGVPADWNTLGVTNTPPISFAGVTPYQPDALRAEMILNAGPHSRRRGNPVAIRQIDDMKFNTGRKVDHEDQVGGRTVLTATFREPADVAPLPTNWADIAAVKAWLAKFDALVQYDGVPSEVPGTAGGNTSTFVATSSLTYFRFQRTGAGTVNLTNFSFTQVSEASWTGGGAGSFTITSDTQVTLNSVGTAPTYARKPFSTVAGRKYIVTSTWANNSGNIKIGTSSGGSEILLSTNTVIGANSHEFVADGPITHIEIARTPAGSATVSGLGLTELSTHAWYSGGNGTTSVTDNETMTLTGSGSGTTYLIRPIVSQKDREYIWTFTVSGGTPGRMVGSTFGNFDLAPLANATAGVNTVKFAAISHVSWLRLQQVAASTAISITNSTYALVPFENAANWTIVGTGTTSISADQSVTINGNGTVTAARRTYNTIPGKSYLLRFDVDGGATQYQIGTTDGGAQIVPATLIQPTPDTGGHTVTFTATTALTHFHCQRQSTGFCTVSRPVMSLSGL